MRFGILLFISISVPNTASLASEAPNLPGNSGTYAKKEHDLTTTKTPTGDVSTHANPTTKAKVLPEAMLRQPVPEASPIDVLVISAMLFSIEPDTRTLVVETLKSGGKVQVLTTSEWNESYVFGQLAAVPEWQNYPQGLKLVPIDHDSVWLRDYAGIVGKERAGDVFFVNTSYREGAFDDHKASYLIAAHSKMGVRALPYDLAGGNFQTDGKRCFLADDGSTSVTQASFIDSLRSNLGCEETVFFSNPAHEHIDMWAKVINRETVFVGQVLPETIQVTRAVDPLYETQARNLQTTLDRAAAQFRPYFAKIVRVPMPFLSPQLFASYLNGILVNNTALVPRYEAPMVGALPYVDQKLLATYEKKVEAAYQSAGYRVVFLRADKLIKDGGAWHCATTSIPLTPGKTTTRM